MESYRALREVDYYQPHDDVPPAEYAELVKRQRGRSAPQVMFDLDAVIAAHADGVAAHSARQRTQTYSRGETVAERVRRSRRLKKWGDRMHQRYNRMLSRRLKLWCQSPTAAVPPLPPKYAKAEAIEVEGFGVFPNVYHVIAFMVSRGVKLPRRNTLTTAAGLNDVTYGYRVRFTHLHIRRTEAA